MVVQDIIKALNVLLEQEHACAIRYGTHAVMLQGPYAEAVEARLLEIAQDEIHHATVLRERIVALGGIPSMHVSTKDLKPADNLEDILQVNIDEEKGAIRQYAVLLDKIPAANVILRRAIEDLLRDEQEHLEELESLKETDH